MPRLLGAATDDGKHPLLDREHDVARVCATRRTSLVTASGCCRRTRWLLSPCALALCVLCDRPALARLPSRLHSRTTHVRLLCAHKSTHATCAFDRLMARRGVLRHTSTWETGRVHEQRMAQGPYPVLIHFPSSMRPPSSLPPTSVTFPVAATRLHASTPRFDIMYEYSP